MRILVIGSGGREHALVRALDPGRHDVHAAPGNPGIEALAETHPDTPPTPDGILALARKLGPDPRQPLRRLPHQLPVQLGAPPRMFALRGGNLLRLALPRRLAEHHGPLRAVALHLCRVMWAR